MRVLVSGAGQVGFNIARHLAAEEIDVAVIDHDPDRIRRVNDNLDVQSVFGFASHPDILEQAGAADAEMLIAVTQSDEINMVSCQVAHSLFNVPKKIARVRHPSYLDTSWSHMFSRDHLPIDVIISPEVEVVHAISRRLVAPGAVDMRGFADDRVRLIGVRVDDNCPIVNTPLRQLTELFPDLHMTIVAILREENTLVPTGLDQILTGDEVYFVVKSDQMMRAMTAFGHDETEAQRLLILGGGEIGLALAERLEASDRNYNVKLIEAEHQRAEHVADRLGKTVVLSGSALDSELLLEANIRETETVIAVTDKDEVNLLASVLAKRNGCARAITLVNATTYSPLISPLGVDAAVSPRELTVSSILEHVRRGKIRAIYTLRGGEAEIIEAEAMETSPVVGVPLSEARLPRGVLVGAAVRGDEVIMPRADTVLRDGDRVVLFATHDAVKKVEQLFSVALSFF